MAGEIQRVLVEATEDEYKYMLQGGDKVHLGWMPFQIADFTAIMTECMAETNGVRFLEVGSGIGTKSLIAHTLFGLTTTGIEVNPDLFRVMLRKGRGYGFCMDALDFEWFHSYDIIWMYRPFRDRDLERKLEQKIYAEMNHGAIFAGAQLETFPGDGFIPVIDDLEIRRGAWKKV